MNEKNLMMCIGNLTHIHTHPISSGEKLTMRLLFLHFCDIIRKHGREFRQANTPTVHHSIGTAARLGTGARRGASVIALICTLTLITQTRKNVQKYQSLIPKSVHFINKVKICTLLDSNSFSE